VPEKVSRVARRGRSGDPVTSP
jgi:hypothetical protein